MARQQHTKPAPSRQSRRIQGQSAAAAESLRVRKHARNLKRNERKKRNKALGAEALRRQRAGDELCASCQLQAELYKAAHLSTARSDHDAAAADPPTRDAATSTADLMPVTVDLTRSASEVSSVNPGLEGRYVPRFVDPADAATPEERARIMRDRKIFGLQVWSWVVVFPFVAVCLNSWRSQPNEPWLVGLRA